MHTIGESAALGAAGIILWGGREYIASKVSNYFFQYLEYTLDKSF